MILDKPQYSEITQKNNHQQYDIGMSWNGLYAV